MANTEKEHEKIYIKSGYITDFEVEISIDNPTFWQKITRQYIRNYKVKALTLQKNIMITDVLIDVPNFDEIFLKKIEQPAEAILMINQHTKKLAKIISILLNEKVDFILKNLTNNDIYSLMQKVISLIGVESFFSSLGLAKMKVAMTKN